ncbi:MAG: 6-phosphogluconolactonase [Desulfovibrio sp.]|jgi:6-phosphogluconolactonase|nr:6-phosphogluconolactonase [Desulfovibrio sp.]
MISVQLSLHVAPDEEAMARQALAFVSAASKEAIAQRGVFTLAVSGGSTPIPLFRLLAGSDGTGAVDWGRAEVYWVDERCVKPESGDSNYGMVRRELLTKVESTRYYRMKGEDLPEKAAKDYEDLLSDHFSLGPGEFPRFDCILLGVGANGHTGSLFPDDPALRETRRLVLDVFSREAPQPRLTMTLPVLNNARCCIFLASGRQKNHILSTALNLMAAPLLPAQMVRPRDGKLCWIIDNNAYQG